MSKLQHFTNLIVWQKAHQLALQIYQLTKDFPKEERFGLTSQLRRAAVSVSANIAEGFKRIGTNDQRHFYNIAASSLAELHAELLLVKDLGYFINIPEDTFNKVDEVAKLLNRWIRGC